MDSVGEVDMNFQKNLGLRKRSAFGYYRILAFVDIFCIYSMLKHNIIDESCFPS